MGYKQYCKNYQDIENYEKAKKANFIGWECHHRLETHNSDGIRREVDITRGELLALGMYYDRPASELIFLTRSEHMSLHQKGKKCSEETKKKLSEALKGKYIGKASSMYGRRHSEESKRRNSEAHKGEKHPMYGKHFSEESKKKMSDAKKGEKHPAFGKHWFNNGKISKRAYECPEGFVPGRISWKK